ncbi:hypothetical protein ABZ589_38070, partial [Streptomyces sp. NPDC013313]|uniref:hypothetical protein n=1 Tax=Streptomyces sp. NPDC013313 TaxID=3155603 RepID=UPI0033FD079E
RTSGPDRALRHELRFENNPAHLLELQESITAGESLDRIHDGDRTIEGLLVNSAGDDVAASAIGQLATDLTDLRRARESALAELRGELYEFEERD